MIYLDTHIAVWLACGETARLSRRAARLIEHEELVISPIVKLEMELLKEIGRIRVSADTIYELLQREIGLTTCTYDFGSVIKAALPQRWTRDLRVCRVAGFQTCEVPPMGSCGESVNPRACWKSGAKGKRYRHFNQSALE